MFLWLSSVADRLGGAGNGRRLTFYRPLKGANSRRGHRGTILGSQGIAGAGWPHSSKQGAGTPLRRGCQSAFKDKTEVYFGRLVLKAIQFQESHTESMSSAEYCNWGLPHLLNLNSFLLVPRLSSYLVHFQFVSKDVYSVFIMYLAL